MNTRPDQLRIRRGSAEDAGVVIALFDEAITWLVARGQRGQWGSEPYGQTPSSVLTKSR